MIPIIIPTWNNKPMLDECLKALKESTIPVCPIIVDNGSMPPVECDERIIRLDYNSGFTNGMNEGIKAAYDMADYFILLNDDTEVFPDCVEKLVEVASQDQTIGIVSSCPVKSRLLPIERQGSVMADLLGGCNLVSRDYNFVVSCVSVQFHGVLITKKLIQAIGLLDGGFINFCSDGDFCLRAAMNRFKVCMRNDALLIHRGSKTSDRVPDKHLKEDQQYFIYKWLGGVVNDMLNKIYIDQPGKITAELSLILRGDPENIKTFKKKFEMR